MPMMLVEIEKIYKSIYDLKECCGLEITVEALRTRTDKIQCHKCQEFGHSQHNCHIEYRCMKCAENHSTHLCEKPRTTPAKCANCSGEHLSTWIKCPENPSNPDRTRNYEIYPTKYIEAPIPKVNPWANKKAEDEKKRDENKTENHTSENQNHPSTSNKNNTKMEQLANIIGRMVINFHSTNASTKQKMDFLQQTAEVINIYNSDRHQNGNILLECTECIPKSRRNKSIHKYE